MVPLIIIISVLALLLLILFLPVGVDIEFKEELFLKIRVGGVKVYEIAPQSEEEPKSADEESDKKAENQAKSFFKALSDKKGYLGAVKELLYFAEALLNSIKGLLKHIKFRRLCLNIKVASADAAKTALEYGAVCSAAYPALSLLDSVLNLKMQKINIYSDFDSSESEFDFSVAIRVQVIYLLIVAFAAFKEYNNFKTRNEL